ncbi:hypothetical protein PG993_001338 [Apiospora rasikravindrae]|uniref:DUF3074 domain-containing protein n=1 Tax=Apiospora rasikravindrae TaxID=990691 RepID=A0ABR1UB32_9PEZI
MTSAVSIGPLVRLWGISASRLPSPTASSDDLAPFLVLILQEALPFIDSAAPRHSRGADSGSSAATTAATAAKSPWKPKSVKTSPADSAAPIEVSERVVGAGELETVVSRALLTDETKKKVQSRLGNEVWACRRSAHADAAQKGTASWAEFVRCFRDEHAAAEDGFTPAVVATCEALSWDCSGVGSVHIAEDEDEDNVSSARQCWGRFTLKVVEMRHKIGRPVLKDRTFPVLQLTATSVPVAGEAGVEPREFVVVSIPVPDFGTNEASQLARDKGAQIAAYVSIERIRVLDARDQEGQSQNRSGKAGEIEWLMATASDAGGVLPSWVQNMAMPGIIWKDVPLFLKWIAGERLKKDVAKVGPVEGAEATENTTATSTSKSAVRLSAPKAAAASEEVPDDTDVTNKIAAAFDAARESEAADFDARTGAMDLK